MASAVVALAPEQLAQLQNDIEQSIIRQFDDGGESEAESDARWTV